MNARSSQTAGSSCDLLLTAVFAGPLQAYAQATARQLVVRQPYIDAVLGAQPVPPAHDVRREMRERGELK